MHIPHYEIEAALNQYLLCHYGSDHDQLPFEFGPKNAINFPVRCITECLDINSLPSHATALDLGCAVGRSSFELARYCENVIAIDNSKLFISAAQHLQQKGTLEYTIAGEGAQSSRRIAKVPENIDLKRVNFICGDAMDPFQKPILFQVILAANLLCRLPEPLTFLKFLHTLVAPGGQLILISPYSWLEAFTPKSNWIGIDCVDTKSTLQCIQDIFKDQFQLIRSFQMPFLMREHLRLYQWGISQASIWRRTLN